MRKALAVVVLAPLVAVQLVGGLFIVLSFLPPFFFILPVTLIFGLALIAGASLASVVVAEWGFA